MTRIHPLICGLTAVLLVLLDGQAAWGFSASKKNDIINRQNSPIINRCSSRSSDSIRRSKPLLPRSMETTTRTHFSTALLASTDSDVSSSTISDDPADTLRQARDFAFADDVEFEEHYHPYRDYEQKMEESRTWLQQMEELQENPDINQEEATEIVIKLQKQIRRYERRLAKRQGANSVVPSIAMELSVGALVMVVGIFWTTLDMTQKHEVTPANFQDWLGLAQEKGYLINMLDLSHTMRF